MKRIRNLLKASVKSLLKNRMRSLLTSLGVIIGVGAVIVMVGVGAGAQADVEAEISSLGANMIMIFPNYHRSGNVSMGTVNRLTLEDVEALRENATMISAISPMIRSGVQVIGGGTNWNTQVNGVTPDYLEIRMLGIASGEMHTERHERAKSKVAVLGQTVVENLFVDQDPVGQQIRINNTPFKVIGVLEEKGEDTFGRDQDDVVLTPATTALYRLSGGKYVSMIYASAVSMEASEDAQEELLEILREEHKIAPMEEDDFRVRNQAEFLETATETQRVMTLLLGAVAAVSLVVGGIGIMNIMLVSVTERTREIGIRLAVGAKGNDILTQFLTESVMLSLVGGTIGVVIAYAVAFVLNRFAGMTTLINPVVVLLAFGFAAAVGVFFGIYPARKAARLNPIDALRYE